MTPAEFVRAPAVAGRFYPDDPVVLSSMMDSFIDPHAISKPAIGVVVPHAGYMYSGHVAGAAYSRIAMPSRTIVLCPNHTGLGAPLSIMRQGSWQTPLGTLRMDHELSEALMSANPELEDEPEAHRWEHAIEVQLPFLQSRGVTGFVPITVGVSDWETLERLGRSIGETILRLDPATLLIASSDMNHYESDRVTRRKDAMAIVPLLNRDAEELHATVRRENISMCGAGPAVAMLVAARLLKATQAELVRYATSAEVSRDFARVVGYAGVIVT
jgi:hypothetical protein